MFENFGIILFLSYAADRHTHTEQKPMNALLPQLSWTWVITIWFGMYLVAFIIIIIIIIIIYYTKAAKQHQNIKGTHTIH